MFSGILALTVSRKSPVPEFGPYPSMSAASPELNISAGRTRIKIVFEGVYTESAKGDGERVLCMVGTALLPKRSGSGSGGNGIDPWGWAKNSGRSSFQPPVMADSNILLLLRYPKELTLTTRAVLGTMGSTSARVGCRLLRHRGARGWAHTIELPVPVPARRARRRRRAHTTITSSNAAADVVSNRAREDVYNGSYPCDVLRR